MSQLGPFYGFSSCPENKPEIQAVRGEYGKNDCGNYHIPVHKIVGWGTTFQETGSALRRSGITMDDRGKVIFRPKGPVPFGGAAGGAGDQTAANAGGGGRNAGNGASARDPSMYEKFASSKHTSAYYQKPIHPSTNCGFRAGQAGGCGGSKSAQSYT